MTLSPTSLSRLTAPFTSEGTALYAFARDGSLKWSRQFPNTSFSPPILGPDGTIYGTRVEQTARHGALRAVNPDGSERWTFQVAGKYCSGLAFGPEGTLYMTSSDGATYRYADSAAAPRLHALNADGQELWSMPLPFQPVGMALSGDGLLYLTGTEHTIYDKVKSKLVCLKSAEPREQGDDFNARKSAAAARFLELGNSLGSRALGCRRARAGTRHRRAW